jgi:adenine-specific DNA-methyltransferase
VTDLPEHLDLRSQNIAECKVQELLRLFPEIRTQGGRLDFDRLRLALGDAADVGRERYGMTWPGKADCFRTIQMPSLGTLRPCPEESVDFDATENLIIEGDNLEVLKLLQKSYLGKVKMIYIDPPYNTGNDFIYPDNYAESLQTYLEYTGQVDADGRRFSTNTEADGRFHSKWLNMMYPRLYLARNLLREDGVIFISIDDGEVRNLRALCDEIFGEENFIATLVVQSNPRGRHLSQFIAQSHEYVLAVARNAEAPSTISGLEKADEQLAAYDKEDAGGRFRDMGLRNSNRSFNPRTRPTLFYPLYVNPASGRVSTEKSDDFSVEVWPISDDGVETCWTWSPAKVRHDNELLIARTIQSGSWRIYRKDYLVGDGGEVATTLAKSVWMDREFNIDNGSRRVRDLLGEVPLQFPKAPALLDRLLRIGSGPDDLILDFFAGAGVTADAVLTQNRAEGSHRRFILVQLPEPTEREDYPTIADIAKERVRRVIRKLDDQEVGKLDLEGEPRQDRGFRVFRLAESNFKPWNADVAHETAALEEQLALHIDHIREGRTPLDLLYEILLKSGFELTTPVETLRLADKIVHSVAGGALLVCLERELTLDLIRAIGELKPERVVCLDEGFAGNDHLKANAVQIFKTQGVTSFRTV